jgi:hypothetical protein
MAPFLFRTLGILISIFLSMQSALPAQEGREQKRPPRMEIPAGSRRLAVEAATQPRLPVQEPGGPRIPEIPPEIKERELGPAEKETMARLEEERAAGDLTETEYDLEKDVLVRDSNISF